MCPPFSGPQSLLQWKEMLLRSASWLTHSNPGGQWWVQGGENSQGPHPQRLLCPLEPRPSRGSAALSLEMSLTVDVCQDSTEEEGLSPENCQRVKPLSRSYIIALWAPGKRIPRSFRHWDEQNAKKFLLCFLACLWRRHLSLLSFCTWTDDGLQRKNVDRSFKKLYISLNEVY